MSEVVSEIPTSVITEQTDRPEAAIYPSPRDGAPGTSGAPGSPGGNVLATGLAAALSGVTIAGGTNLIQTTGYSTVGVGAAVYVDDALSDAGMASAHPLFCKADAAGRYFRLLPVHGEIDVAKAGAVGGDTLADAANEQPILAAAIRYAEAIGARGIVLTAPHYRLWCPERTTDDAEDQFVSDGIHLVCNRPITIRGIGAGKRELHFFGYSGVDPNDVEDLPETYSAYLDSVDINEGVVPWRGHAIQLVSSNTETDRELLGGVTLINVRLQGNTLATGVSTYNPVTGDGWDYYTHKGIQVQPLTNCGSVKLIDSDIVGFRGELIYCAGAGGIDNSLVVLGDCFLGETNGQFFNPNWINHVQIDGAVCENGYLSVEGPGGRNSYIRARLINCPGGGGFAGGRAGSPVIYSNRRYDAPLDHAPWMEVDLVCIDASPEIGSFVCGRIHTTDKAFTITGPSISTNWFVTDVDLDLTCVCDREDDYEAIVLGAHDSANAKNIANLSIRYRLERTAAARAAGRRHKQPVLAYGSLGADVRLIGQGGDARLGNSFEGTIHNYTPVYQGERFGILTDYFGVRTQDVEATPALALRSDIINLTASTENGAHDFTIDVTNCQDGQMLWLTQIASGQYSLRCTAGAQWPRGLYLGFNQWVGLRFNRQMAMFEIVSRPQPVEGNATLTISAIAANAASAEQSITVPGALTGMPARVWCNSDLGAGLAITGVRALDDEVKFIVKDEGGAGATPPAGAIYRAEAG